MEKRYIKSYETRNSAIADYASGQLNRPFVVYIKNQNLVVYDAQVPNINWENEYFTIIAITDGTISYSHKEGSNPMFYSINEGEWVETNVSVDIPVIKNDMIRFKSNRGNQAYNQQTFTSGGTAKFAVAGNLMSLVAGDDFATYVPYTNPTGTDGDLYQSFITFFKNNTNLISAKYLIINYTDNASYREMFYGCTSLTTPPELPATTLGNFCYYQMFQNCTSLAQVPDLPAETLANNCYQNMFMGCTSLTTIPSNYLPATTLTQRCYCDMFHNCRSLTNAPELPATTLNGSCYRSMFDGCTSLTSAPAILPAITITPTYCYQYMFRGCTSLTTAPELPAITLSNGCYTQMFKGCTNLNYIKCLATDISASNCTSNWMEGVPATGTFVKNPYMSSWETGVNGIPEGWTVIDAQ